MNQYGLTGRGIGIAMLDTGIFPHMDFDNRIICFRDFIYGRKQPYDDNGHGTHTAGIAAGSGAAGGGQHCGAAPGSRIIALKVLDRRGNGQKDDVLRAMEWIRRNRKTYGIRIVNISVGTTEKEPSLHEALIAGVERLWDDGLHVSRWGPQICSRQARAFREGDRRRIVSASRIWWRPA